MTARASPGSFASATGKMTIDEERRLVDANLAESLLHFTDHAEGGATATPEGLVLFAGAHHYPGAYTNGVLRLDASMAPAQVLGHAERFFAGRRRGYAIWVRGHADGDLEEEVRRAGLFLRPPEGGMPGMVRESPIERIPRAPGGRIVRVERLSEGWDYVRVVAEAYGLRDVPQDLPAALLFDPRSLLAPNVAAFVAYVGQRPVAGAMTIVAAGAAGLYWAATVPAAGGHGFGSGCLTLATNAGFELGGEIACMQSSAAATGMWGRLGFVEITRYRRYLAPPAGRHSSASPWSAGASLAAGDQPGRP